MTLERLNLFYFIDKDDSEGITLDEFEEPRLHAGPVSGSVG